MYMYTFFQTPWAELNCFTPGHLSIYLKRYVGFNNKIKCMKWDRLQHVTNVLQGARISFFSVWWSDREWCWATVKCNPWRRVSIKIVKVLLTTMTNNNKTLTMKIIRAVLHSSVLLLTFDIFYLDQCESISPQVFLWFCLFKCCLKVLYWIYLVIQRWNKLL